MTCPPDFAGVAVGFVGMTVGFVGMAVGLAGLVWEGGDHGQDARVCDVAI